MWHACVPVSWPCGFLGLMLHPWVRASGSVIVFWPWPSDCQSVLSGWDSVSLSAELHCLLHCSVMSCIVTGRSKRTDPPRSFKGHWTAPCLDAAALSDGGDRSVLWRRRPKIKGLPHIDRAASAEAALTQALPVCFAVICSEQEVTLGCSREQACFLLPSEDFDLLQQRCRTLVIKEKEESIRRNIDRHIK